MQCALEVDAMWSGASVMAHGTATGFRVGVEEAEARHNKLRRVFGLAVYGGQPVSGMITGFLSEGWR